LEKEIEEKRKGEGKGGDARIELSLLNLPGVCLGRGGRRKGKEGREWTGLGIGFDCLILSGSAGKREGRGEGGSPEFGH